MLAAALGMTEDEAQRNSCWITSGSASIAATSRSNSRILAAALDRLQRCRDPDRPRATELGARCPLPCVTPTRAAEMAQQLGAFADTTYLHQVVEQSRSDRPALSRSRRRAVAANRVKRRQSGASTFHVPLFAREYEVVRLDPGLRAAGACARACNSPSRRTSRSRPIPGTCCRRASRWTSANRSPASTSGFSQAARPADRFSPTTASPRQ